MRAFRHTAVRLSVVAALALSVAACGGDDTDSTTTAATDTGGAASSGVEASREVATKALQPGDTIPVTDPLPNGRPAKKTVAFIEPQIPAGKTLTPSFKAATEAMGWDLKVIPTDPFKPAGAVQQAIDQKVDFIALAATPMAMIKEQMKAAEAAGIGVYSCFGTDVPADNPGLMAQCGDASSAELDGSLLADWAISDSDGKANVLTVNIPDYPILVALEKGFNDRIAENCPDCKTESLGVTVDDLAKGTVPQAVASKLQANPDIDYVFFSMSDLPTGVSQTLKGAGIGDKVKLFGLDFNEARLKGLKDGTEQVWMGLPKAYSSWLLVDMMARQSEGQELTDERKLADLPRILVTKDTAGEYMDSLQWPGPVGFEDQFKALWGANAS